ncbi:hypothetical protein THRCLA_11702 [Thraustotheca clavata]|uniref:ARMC9 CTLH-like domain-containing protein n=1 Tax=Thraustotheca clavata TaxID=74557 RepID=A0A1V9Y6Y3_9STRA|nr:hypothetical protein THRCLA_11702 [Thraustotheca clavata]
MPFVLANVDELVLEYLLFRGFTKTFQMFVYERKKDRGEGLDIDALVHQIFQYIKLADLEQLTDVWEFLDARFFCHLDSNLTPSVHRLKTSLERCYIVHAMQLNQTHKVIEFFKKYASIHRLSNAIYQGWQPWFMLPYMDHPETDPYFKEYFSLEWTENLTVNLRNFLSTVFQHVPLPKLLAFQIAQSREPLSQLRLESSQAECHQLRLDIKQAYDKLKVAEANCEELHQTVQNLTHRYFAHHLLLPTRAPEPLNTWPLTLSSKVRAMAIAQDGEHLAIGGATLHVVPTCATLSLELTTDSVIQFVIWLSDNKSILCGLVNGDLVLHSLQNLQSSNQPQVLQTRPSKSNIDYILSLSRDNNTVVVVASSSPNGEASLELLDVEKDTVIAAVTLLKPVSYLTVTNLVVFCCHEGIVTAYDAYSLQLITSWAMPDEQVITGVGYLSQRRTILTTTNSHIHEWCINLATWTAEIIYTIAISSRLLAVSDKSYLIESEKELQVYEAQTTDTPIALYDVQRARCGVWSPISKTWYVLDRENQIHRLLYDNTGRITE